MIIPKMVKINVKRTFAEAIRGNESIKSYSRGFVSKGKDEVLKSPLFFDK